mgnify:CR=1 FL=1|jgi:hypothetical protein|tara:strand:+ start:1503 stop:1799 length:297 start_codon:yes stop_codon:yes gene_type:complete
MTPEQMELLANMIAKKVIDSLNVRFTDDPNFDVLQNEQFLDKSMDAFGNPKLSEKDLLASQLTELSITGEKLLKEEKYELLKELKEIYDKIKTEYDKL